MVEGTFKRGGGVGSSMEINRKESIERKNWLMLIFLPRTVTYQQTAAPYLNPANMQHSIAQKFVIHNCSCVCVRLRGNALNKLLKRMIDGI